MDLGLENRLAVICASSKGLGFACAKALAAEGTRVVLNGRSETSLRLAADALKSEFGTEIAWVAADLSTADGRSRLLEEYPSPDILVNNNGGPPTAIFEQLERCEILAALEANMLAPVELIHAILPSMMARGFGRIVNITSIAVRMPLPDHAVSSAARAGLTAILANVARRAARHGVTINHLMPGFFSTDRLTQVLGAEAIADGSAAARIPAGRLGEPDELGRLCAFLCGVPAGYITGQSLLIDGGLHEVVL